MTPDITPPTLRPMSNDDLPFIRALYATTRDQEMALVDWSPEQKAAFLDMQFNAQHQWYTTQYDGAQFSIVMVGSETIGRVYLHPTPGMLNLVDIALLPQWRGRGIGTHLMREVVMNPAAARGDKVGLYVEFWNPAMRLYERLGFKHVSNNQVHFHMIWEPTS